MSRETEDRVMGFEGRYRALSYPFDLATDPSTIGEELDRLLDPFRSRSSRDGAQRYEISRSGSGFSVRVGGEQVYETAGERDILGWLLSDVHAGAIERERAMLVIHAGAVSWKGRGVMLPAAPDSGKTTTVAGLVRAGFDYLTDESALVDPDTLQLVPYPFALKMERPSIEAVFGSVPDELRGRLGVFTRLHPHEIRPASIGGRCDLRFLIIPRYERGAATAMEPINRADALVATAMQGVNLKRLGVEGFRVLERLFADLECYRLRIGDLHEAVDLISEVVERR